MVPAHRASAPAGVPPLDPAMADGDRRLAELYDLHGSALYRFLLRWTLGEPQAAEDLLQETLLRAWRNLDHLNADLATVRPWLFTVARRIAIDASRARRARPAEIGVEDMSAIAGVEDDIERMLDAQAIRRALWLVSADHRRVIVEIYYRGRSVSEAAEALGIPEGTVKSRTYHALRALRAVIDSTDQPS